MPEVAANVNIRYSRASLDQLLELLRSAEFVGLAGNDKAQLELTGMTAGFGCARAGRPFRFGMMMVVMVVIVIVMIMVVIVIVMIMVMLMLMLMLMMLVFMIV